MVGSLFASKYLLDPMWKKLKDGISHQFVKNHDVNLFHQALGLDGQEVRVARSGANQVYGMNVSHMYAIW